ncbi:MAG: B12-binding domain-containing radical SAM protein [Deltaproteobacteria bacterium]|nr:MAG: B12-binding domain-containing radical SAM protein [Deltaproteobacteria bacterium]
MTDRLGTTQRNLLLINPWIYDFAAYDLWAKPLGLVYLAALLEKNGWRINYIDCLDVHHLASKVGLKPPKRRPDHRGHFYREQLDKPPPLGEIPRRFHRFGLPPELFQETLQSLPTPQAILVSSGMTYWYLGVQEVIKVVKEVFPAVPVILGGIYATLCADHAGRISGADFVIKGWGEVQILELLEELTAVYPLFLPDLTDLDRLPYPAFRLYPKGDYVCILTSRGCPFQCTYCASSLLNPGFLKRDPVKVVDEVAHWVRRYGVEDIAFYDDALLVDQEFAMSLLRGIEGSGIKARFHTPNGLHVRGVTEEVGKLMRHVGFTTVRLGLETSCAERQLATGGKVSNEDFRTAVRNLRQVGYSAREIGTYIMVGLPGQKRDEVEETIHFIWDSGARPYLAEYSPIPGTPLWEEAVETSPFDLEGEPLFHNNTILPCRWEGLSWNDLRELKDMVQKEVPVAS